MQRVIYLRELGGYMKKLFILVMMVLTTCIHAQEPAPGTISFQPPKGWNMAETEELPDHVQVMVIGKGLQEFPPSLNLSMEEYEGTLADYLSIVKEINDANGSEWKDLGSIDTAAGPANLSQADATTQWGPVRMMHVILVKDGMVYILTGASLAKEFPQYYRDFFESFKSLRFNE